MDCSHVLGGQTKSKFKWFVPKNGMVVPKGSKAQVVQKYRFTRQTKCTWPAKQAVREKMAASTSSAVSTGNFAEAARAEMTRSRTTWRARTDRQTDRQRRQQAAKAFAEKQNINYNNNNNNKRGGGIIIGCLP